MIPIRSPQRSQKLKPTPATPLAGLTKGMARIGWGGAGKPRSAASTPSYRSTAKTQDPFRSTLGATGTVGALTGGVNPQKLLELMSARAGTAPTKPGAGMGVGTSLAPKLGGPGATKVPQVPAQKTPQPPGQKLPAPPGQKVPQPPGQKLPQAPGQKVRKRNPKGYVPQLAKTLVG
jgi:hypothetical protein